MTAVFQTIAFIAGRSAVPIAQYGISHMVAALIALVVLPPLVPPVIPALLVGAIGQRFATSDGELLMPIATFDAEDLPC